MRFSHSCLEIWSHKACLASEKIKENRKFYIEKIWKVLQLEKCKKVFKWVNQVFIYRPRSSGHLASSKRSSGGFFTKKLGKIFRTSSNNFAWLCKVKSSLAPFSSYWGIRMTLRNFRMAMRNQFSLFPFWATTKILFVSFCTTVRIFRMFMRNWKTWFSNFLLPFLPFLPFESTSITFNSTPKPSPSASPLPHPHCVPFSIPFLFCHSMLQKSP